MTYVRYEKALPHQLEEALARAPVAYVPWGALEWHGLHLALGNDAVKVEALCDRIAELTGGVVLPPVWVGARTMQHHGMPLTLDFSAEIVRALAGEYLRELEKVGFALAVILAGHYGRLHVEALRAEAEDFTSAHEMAVWVITDYDPVIDLGYGGDHAAKWETSILMHLRPELVDMGRLPTDPGAELAGVGGQDPREHAGPELGKMIVEAIVERIAGRVNEFLRARA